MEYKKVYIETYGCQMNEYDSGVVSNLLKNQSYQIVTDEKKSDIILLNTCAVRENAHAKIYSRLKHLKAMKKKNPNLLVGILGCMAQNLGENILNQDLDVDMVVGPDNYRNLDSLIAGRRKEVKQFTLTQLSKTETYGDIYPEIITGISSSVTIMRGCNNFCTFCVVPYTRGRERSRSAESIVDEIKGLIAKGIKNVTLLGQNVNSYKYGNDDFSSLIEKILQQTEIPRIRFTSPHPKDFPEKLLYLMAANKRFSPSIHLPLQAGSNKILKLMKRNYTSEDYLNLVEKIMKIIPDVGITTDVIVGFPNETEEDFLATLFLMKTIRFDNAYMYKYSEREGTKAKELYPDNVTEHEKSERLIKLVDLKNRVSLEKNSAKIGKIFEVQVEALSKKSAGEFSGKTNCGRTVVFPHENAGIQIGDLVNVKIEKVTSATLLGLLH